MNIKVNDLQDLPAPALGEDGSIVAEVWTGIGGRAVRALTKHSLYPGEPSFEDMHPVIDFTNSELDLFGRRIIASLQVAESGLYRFRISADDSAELWLASDNSPANKRLLAYTNRATGYRVWDAYKTQTSVEVNLVADTPYFLEIIHKEKKGDDYLVVEAALSGGDFSTLTQEWLTRYIPDENNDTNLPPTEARAIHETAYHAGYVSGLNWLAYDASYPMADQDKDGLPDFYEIAIGTNPNDMSDAIADTDGDTLSNYEEYRLLSNPTLADTDGDAIDDGYEIAFGLNHLDSSDAQGDLDEDGFSNLEEYYARTSPDDASHFPTSSETEVLLSWQPPEQKEDGTALDINDIERYKVYSGSSAEALTEITSITNLSQPSLTLTLGEGTHYYAISAVAYEEGEGPRSEVISVTIN